MQHLRKGRIFGRKTDQRKALMKSLSSSFFVLGKIKTTEAKARELRPFVERMLTRAKNPSLANRRFLARYFVPHVVKKVFEQGAQVSSRTGGYTRIIKMGKRASDAASMAIIEMVK